MRYDQHTLCRFAMDNYVGFIPAAYYHVFGHDHEVSTTQFCTLTCLWASLLFLSFELVGSIEARAGIT